MSDEQKLTAFELDRLDLFAVQTLVKCLLAKQIAQETDKSMFTRKIASLYEDSVAQFVIGGASEAKDVSAREYILQAGHEMIASAQFGAARML